MQTNRNPALPDLIIEISLGSEAALIRFIKAQKEPLMKRIRGILPDKSLSEEVFTDVLVIIWEHRESLRGMRNPIGWIMTAAVHRAINARRAKRRQSNRFISTDSFPFQVDAADIEAALEFKELEQLIEQAQEKLTPKERMVFQLRRQQQLSYKEIAQRSATSVQTVKNQFHSACRHLRDWFGKTVHSVFI